MNAYINETGTVRKKKDRVFIMTVVSCALSVLGVLMKSFYADAEILPYDPSMLFILSLITGSMLLSCALTVLLSKGRYVLYLITLALPLVFSCSVHVLLGASAAETLLALAFVPSAAVVSLCMSSSCEKTHTLSANAVVLMLTLLSALALSHYESFGEISAASLGAVKSSLLSSFEEVLETYSYAGLGITQAQLHEVFELSVLLTPAFAIALVSILSYIEITLTRILVLDRDVCKEGLTHWPLKLSRLASVIFLVSFLIFVFAVSDEKKILVMTGANLFIALLPGFFLLGLRAAPSHFKRPGLFGILFWILIIMYCIRNPAILLMIFAVMGAFDNLFKAFRERFYGEKTDKKDKK